MTEEFREHIEILRKKLLLDERAAPAYEFLTYLWSGPNKNPSATALAGIPTPQELAEQTMLRALLVTNLGCSPEHGLQMIQLLTHLAKKPTSEDVISWLYGVKQFADALAHFIGILGISRYELGRMLQATLPKGTVESETIRGAIQKIVEIAFQ